MTARRAGAAGTVDIVLAPGGGRDVHVHQHQAGFDHDRQGRHPRRPAGVLVHRFARATFTLDDDPATATPNSFTAPDLADGIYTVTETLVAGWDLQVDRLRRRHDDPGGHPHRRDRDRVGCRRHLHVRQRAAGIDHDRQERRSPTGPRTSSSSPNPAPRWPTSPSTTTPPTPPKPTAAPSPGSPPANTPSPSSRSPAGTLSDLTCDDATGRGDVATVTATITLPEGGDVTCTFTNTRRTATLTLQKTWIDGAAGDTANLDITGLDPATATATATGAPGDETSPNPATTTVFAGETINLTEILAAANLGTYDTTLDCDQPGLDLHRRDLTGTLTIPDTPTPTTCTFTNNRRRAALDLQKAWVDSARRGHRRPHHQRRRRRPAPTRSPRPHPIAAPSAALLVVLSGETVDLTEVLGAANVGTYDTTLTCCDARSITLDRRAHRHLHRPARAAEHRLHVHQHPQTRHADVAEGSGSTAPPATPPTSRSPARRGPPRRRPPAPDPAAPPAQLDVGSGRSST